MMKNKKFSISKFLASNKLLIHKSANKNFIQCVSFPRSGHHLLVNLLLKYFSKNINYQNTDGPRTHEVCKNVLQAGDFRYCEFYQHCQQTPCSDLKINFQKNHDFDLKLKNVFNFKYIIQYRHALGSLVSWYMIMVEKEEIEDSKEAWEFFVYQKIIFWKKFTQKWVLKNKHPNILYLSYEALLKHPQEKLEEVINFIRPETTINLKLIEKIIHTQKIRALRQLNSFKYFDPVFFKKIEKDARQELKALNLDFIFHE